MVKLPTTEHADPPEFLEDRTQLLHDYAALLTLWGEFELMLEIKIADLAGIKPIDASIILGGLNFGNKPPILYSLLNQRGQAEIAGKVKDVINHARRNALVHGIAGAEVSDRTFGFYKREIGETYVVKQLDFTAETFNAHFEKFRLLVQAAALAMQVHEEDMDEYADAAGLYKRARQHSPDLPQREGSGAK